MFSATANAQTFRLTAGVSPAFDPNQPKPGFTVPGTALGTLWPSIAIARLPWCNLPMALPMHGTGECGDAAWQVDHRRSREIDLAIPIPNSEPRSQIQCHTHE